MNDPREVRRAIRRGEHSGHTAGLAPGYLEEGKNVPMYRTAIDTEPAGRFSGKLVVSMRPFKPADAIRAIEITARYPRVHRRAVDPRVAGGDLDCADRVRRLERPHGHHQLATKAAGGRGVVWPECSPRRIARRTSRGSFMARNNIEIQGRDGDLLSALPRQKEIILRNYLFVHLAEVERKTFVKTKSKFDIACHTKNMIAPTIRVLIAEDVA